MKFTFKGGVHPSDNKKLTESCRITAIAAPKQLAMLMSQHIGALCEPVVNKKESVEQGQLIGDSEAFVSAKVHSPVKGIVKDIALRAHPVLGRVKAVIIDVDEDNPAKDINGQQEYANFDISSYAQEAIIAAITDSGIVGMGGAGFPTNVKTMPNPKQPKETLIINACECEPYITCDYRVMLDWTDKFIAGVELLKKASSCRECIIAIEDNKPEAIEVISKKVASLENIRVCVVKTKYPQGGERQLISAVLGKIVPTGQIPPMVGVVVCNVCTAAAVADAVVLGSPLTHRVVTVSGGGVKNPCNFYVPIGTGVEYILEQAGGLSDETAKIILGGPMMGFPIADITTPTTKTTGSILALTKSEIGKAKFAGIETACIRCGRCISVCPEGLNPTKIAHSVKSQRVEDAENNYITACMECGSCAYVCPANIELTGYIKTGKILMARKKKNMPA